MNRHILYLVLAQALEYLALIVAAFVAARWVFALVLAFLATLEGCASTGGGSSKIGALACTVARAACAICDAKEHAHSSNEGAMDAIPNEGTP